MEVQPLVICEKIITDETGRVSYIAVTEKISSDKLPAGLPQIAIGAIIAKHDFTGDAKVRVTCTDQDGAAVISTPPMNLPFTPETRRVNINGSGFRFKSYGTFTFVMEVDFGGGYIEIGQATLQLLPKTAP